MKQYFCIHCCNIDNSNEDELYIDEDKFVEHLEVVHKLTIRSLDACLNSLKSIGVFGEREKKEEK